MSAHEVSNRRRLKTQKTGSPRGTPRFSWGVAGLKEEPEAELQLPHSARRAREVLFSMSVIRPESPAAIDASVALGAAEGKHRMIEYVVSVKAELSLVTLRETERLRQRHIRVEPAGTTVGIAPDIADLARKPAAKTLRMSAAQLDIGHSDP